MTHVRIAFTLRQRREVRILTHLRYSYTLALFCSAFWFAPNQAISEPVDDVRSLAGTLSDLATADTALTKELEELNAVVGRLLGPEKVLSHANTTLTNSRFVTEISDEVSELLTTILTHQSDVPLQRILDLTNLLETEMEEFENVYPEPVRAPLRSLQLRIDRAVRDTPVQAIGAAAQRLKDDIDETPAVADGNVVVEGLETLRETLIELEKVRYYSALSSRIAEVGALLDVSEAERPPLRGGDLGRLEQLRAKIDGLLPAERKAGIHVFSATYGRLKSVGGTGGSCDATSTVRGLCQGETNCAATTDTFNAICGGVDPAPFLQSHQKGLSINYICLNAAPSTWTALLSASARNYGGQTRSAVLRTAGDAIFCQ